MIFIRGFTRSVLRLAIAVVGIYLLLNLIVIVSGIHHLVENPAVVRDWWDQITAGHWGERARAAIRGESFLGMPWDYFRSLLWA